MMSKTIGAVLAVILVLMARARRSEGTGDGGQSVPGHARGTAARTVLESPDDR